MQKDLISEDIKGGGGTLVELILQIYICPWPDSFLLLLICMVVNEVEGRMVSYLSVLISSQTFPALNSRNHQHL